MPSRLAPPLVVPAWWRQPWPWALIALPASMVLIGLGLLAVALHGSDSLVTRHPYERGLRVAGELEQVRHARQLGLHAELELQRGLLSLRLSPPQAQASLHLRLQHPSRRGGDLELLLQRTGPGLYQATAVLDPVVYAVQLQGADWSLAGRWRSDARGSLQPALAESSGEAPQDD